ncbi:MAG: hypothetical protein RL326_971, partial [Pseudomonadota bacterium]
MRTAHQPLTRRVFELVVCCLVAFWASKAHAAPTGSSSTSVATRTEEEQKTIDLYKRVNGSVVFITTRSYVVDPFAFFDEVKPQEGTGTGTVIDVQRGIVITNLHVIESALQSGGSVEIMLSTGQSSKASLIGYDPES